MGSWTGIGPSGKTVVLTNEKKDDGGRYIAAICAIMMLGLTLFGLGITGVIHVN